MANNVILGYGAYGPIYGPSSVHLPPPRRPPLRNLGRAPSTGGAARAGFDYPDRAALEHDRYLNQAGLIAQRQAARQAQAQAPTQGERLEMMRLQHGLAGVRRAVDAGVLDPQEGAAMESQLMSKINPYQVREANYKAQMAQARYQTYMDDTRVKRLANENNGILPIDDPNNPGKKLLLTFDANGKATLLHGGAAPGATKEPKALTRKEIEWDAHGAEQSSKAQADLWMREQHPDWLGFDHEIKKEAPNADRIAEYNKAMTGLMRNHQQRHLEWLDQQNALRQPAPGGDFEQTAPRGEWGGGGGSFGAEVPASPGGLPTPATVPTQPAPWLTPQQNMAIMAPRGPAADLPDEQLRAALGLGQAPPLSTAATEAAAAAGAFGGFAGPVPRDVMTRPEEG